MAGTKTCDRQHNMTSCNCTYEPCPRKGHCCDCIAYHRRSGQLPACYFPNDVEAGYDRSIANFLRVYQDRRR